MQYKVYTTFECLREVLKSPKSDARSNFLFKYRQREFYVWLLDKIQQKVDYAPLIEEYTTVNWIGGKKSVACRLHGDVYVEGKYFGTKRLCEDNILTCEVEMKFYFHLATSK